MHRTPRSCVRRPGGVFVVTVDGVVAWDRGVDGGFPETKVLKQRVRDIVSPGRDLGHSDGDDKSAAPAQDEVCVDCPEPALPADASGGGVGAAASSAARAPSDDLPATAPAAAAAPALSEAERAADVAALVKLHALEARGLNVAAAIRKLEDRIGVEEKPIDPFKRFVKKAAVVALPTPAERLAAKMAELDRITSMGRRAAMKALDRGEYEELDM